MGQRREPRVEKDLVVRVRGQDRYGNPFVQNVRTIDISRRGARLDGLGCLDRPGRIIEVQRGRQQARFRVAWIGQPGTPEASQVGIFCLEAGKYVWGVPLPAPRADNYHTEQTGTAQAPSAEETASQRRRSLRVDLQIPVSVRWFTKDGNPQEKQATTSVINQHGCMLPLKAAVMEGMPLELVNQFNNEVRKGKVVWSAGINSEGHQQVGIELENADSHFWGPKYKDAVRVANLNLSDTWVG